jgi:hypothetical protein
MIRQELLVPETSRNLSNHFLHIKMIPAQLRIGIESLIGI